MSEDYSVNFRKRSATTLADNEKVSLWDPDSTGSIEFSEDKVILSGIWKVSAIGNFLGSGCLGAILIRPFFMKDRKEEIEVANIEQILLGKTKITGSKVYHIFQARDEGMSEVHVFTTSEGDKIESHLSNLLPKEKIKSEE